jgi:uroporphyrinogen-III decarboxylase
MDPTAFQPSAEYQAREKRFNDAVALRKPDRVPVASLAGMFNTKYSGLTHAQAMHDYEARADAIVNTTPKLDWDMVPLLWTTFPGPVMDMLGIRTFKWPGRHLKDDIPFEFVEKEYMLGSEYDEFLHDPGDFVLRRVLPRMSETLEPLAQMPPLHWLSSGFTLVNLGATLAGMPPMVQMLQKLIEAGQEMNKWNQSTERAVGELAVAGYPLLAGAVTVTPFDYFSDMLRGMRGTMLDMYRQPEKLKAAVEYFTPFCTQMALMGAQMTGNPRVYVALHRGSGGFMSDKQFAEYYWPGLKGLLEGLIAAGITPCVFFEGDYTPRLEYLAQLPPGKIAAHFDIIDRKKAKEMIGDVLCFWGNVPASALVTGTPEDVRADVRELVEIFGDNGGLIIDGAVEGVPPDAKPENVEAMVAATLEFGKN